MDHHTDFALTAFEAKAVTDEAATFAGVASTDDIDLTDDIKGSLGYDACKLSMSPPDCTKFPPHAGTALPSRDREAVSWNSFAICINSSEKWRSELRRASLLQRSACLRKYAAQGISCTPSTRPQRSLPRLVPYQKEYWESVGITHMRRRRHDWIRPFQPRSFAEAALLCSTDGWLSFWAVPLI